MAKHSILMNIQRNRKSLKDLSRKCKKWVSFDTHFLHIKLFISDISVLLFFCKHLQSVIQTVPVLCNNDCNECSDDKIHYTIPLIVKLYAAKIRK